MSEPHNLLSIIYSLFFILYNDCVPLLFAVTKMISVSRKSTNGLGRPPEANDFLNTEKHLLKKQVLFVFRADMIFPVAEQFLKNYK